MTTYDYEYVDMEEIDETTTVQKVVEMAAMMVGMEKYLMDDEAIGYAA